jgi:23S rRNA pseudouridine955/2504/2580 synthase
MFLHAVSTRFRHPITGETIELEAALPRDCTDFLRSLQGASAV